jgi:hypothetical protein
MQTTFDLKHLRSRTIASRLPSAAILVAVGVAAAFGTVAFSASRDSVKPADAPVVANCDQASIAASDRLLTHDDPDATKAAVRRERERAFNACLDETAIRGVTTH